MGKELDQIQVRIDTLQRLLKATVARGDAPDVLRIEELFALRREGALALARYRWMRMAEMQKHTQEFLVGAPYIDPTKARLYWARLSEIFEQFERYDTAALKWVNEDVCPWEDSDAAKILTGIVQAFNEIH